MFAQTVDFEPLGKDHLMACVVKWNDYGDPNAAQNSLAQELI